jgi:hypothetical protein
LQKWKRFPENQVLTSCFMLNFINKKGAPIAGYLNKSFGIQFSPELKGAY